MARFDYFIVFAEMRTGSNFLEANLNALDGVNCLGEVFNPYFIAYPNAEDCLGITQAARDADPLAMIEAVRAAPGLNGFRFFHDHDQRVLDLALADPRCAKIVLTRNPAESYVSWKIAQATGQWKLTDVRRRKEEQATFDAEEFEAHLQALQQFQMRLMSVLQVTGQTAFYVDYEDLQSVDVMNGLADWLGVEARLEGLTQKLKVQNPQALSEKVANFDQMEGVLARLDRFNLSRTPNFEPRRGPQVPGFVAATEAPLLYMPVKGGPDRQVEQWLAALDGGKPRDLTRKMSQKDLRQWLRARTGHRSFTVLRHPMARAHAVFCEKILSGKFTEIRKILRQRYSLPIPGKPNGDYSLEQHREAFGLFLDFLKANLAQQTGLRIDPHWASQSALLEGMAQFATPDLVLREEEMAEDLPRLAARLGIDAPQPGPAPADTPYTLAQIHDADLEARAAETYQRDYMIFGFGPWAG
ncbi:Sulfotransferase family protein [Pseudooceanicola marinus]|uniref:Sulfotransferase family protein n=1 Tax=Pseudooceanicola marinus TaxID=396013 RepID=A0A1X7A1U9_9RHOB|nr:sulfotransferase family 2 domain-containing protein [Pseudooceanicola marinus]PJE31236.1 nodulation protein NodH [Pseudooceanicola marinus]SLN68292.1 Sulfotransferase family protein [Pseudooceanicola marinus]